jgi:hypothetical protein
MRPVTICSKIAALACVLSAVACGGEQDSERPVLPATSALENPIAACQAQMSSCQRGPGPGGCEEQMRNCLVSYEEWLRAVREGIAQCRTQAGLCVTGAGTGATCRDGYNDCITALWTSDSGDDAGVAEDDAGAAGSSGAGGRSGRGPRAGSGGAGAGGRGGFPFPGSNGGAQLPGLPGRGPSGSAGAAAGSGALPGLPGLPGLPPPGLPGQTAGQAAPGFPSAPVAPEAQCMEKLTQCMMSGKDLIDCADEARMCMRTDPVSALFRP